MRRGTTPTITATVNADISDMSIHLAFKVGSTLIVKKGEDLDVTTEVVPEQRVNGQIVQEEHTVTHISTSLTQDDTLAMKSGKECEVQIRAVQADGTIAIATTIGTIPVKRILEEGVIRG